MKRQRFRFDISKVKNCSVLLTKMKVESVNGKTVIVNNYNDEINKSCVTKNKKPSGMSTDEHPETNADEISCETLNHRFDSGIEEDLTIVFSNIRKRETNKKNPINNIDSENCAKLNVILSVLEYFKDSSIGVQCTKTLQWFGTMEKTAVDTIVKLADAQNNDEKTAKLCIDAAIETITKVHESITEEVANESIKDTLCTDNWLSLVLMLCESSPICEKTISVFIRKLITLESLDTDEPEYINEQLTRIDQARFALHALTETIKKYVKIREKKSCDEKTHWVYSINNDREIHWSQTLSLYARNNLDNFPLLSKMAWNAVELLRKKSTRNEIQ